MKTKIKYCFWLFKYLPAMGTLYFTVFCASLLFGIQFRWCEFFLDSSLAGVLMMLAGSFAFEFCWVHRAGIFYCWGVSVCIDYQRNVGFCHLQAWRLGAVLAGVAVLVSYLYIWLKTKKNEKEDENGLRGASA